jgi:hypothetical protein
MIEKLQSLPEGSVEPNAALHPAAYSLRTYVAPASGSRCASALGTPTPGKILDRPIFDQQSDYHGQMERYPFSITLKVGGGLIIRGDHLWTH